MFIDSSTSLYTPRVVVLQVATTVRTMLTTAPEMFATSIGKTEASR